MSIRQTLIGYFSYVISQINIQADNIINNQNNKRKNNTKNFENKINYFRSMFIDKVLQVQERNLSNLTPETTHVFNNGFCIFIPYSENNILNIDSDGRCFKNKFGVLIILKNDKAKEILGQMNTTYYLGCWMPVRTHQNDILKYDIIIDLLNESCRKNEGPIYDFSNVEQNICKKLTIRADKYSPDYFNFLNDLINVNKIKKLTIDGLIKRISSDSVTLFNSINELVIASEEIDDIMPENFMHFFQDLINLKIFNLKIIKSNTFIKNNKLKTLQIKSENFIKIEPYAFNGLSGLEILDLSDCLIRKVNKNTFIGLNCLKRLYLNTRKCKKISKESFHDLNNLTYIEIGLFKDRTAVSDIQVDSNIFNCCLNLEVLKVVDSRISSISLSDKLEKLKYIALDDPSFILNHQSLKNLQFIFLNLRTNPIDNKVLEKVVLPNLRYLELSCVRVTKFCQNFKKLQMLKLMNVNQIDSDSFEFLENLECLEIKDSKWLTFNKNKPFKGLNNLKIFSINGPTLEFENVYKVFFGSRDDCKIQILQSEDVYEMEIIKKDYYCFTNVYYLNKILNISSNVREAITGIVKEGNPVDFGFNSLDYSTIDVSLTSDTSLNDI